MPIRITPDAPRARWIMCAAAILLGVLLGGAFAFTRTPVYTAQLDGFVALTSPPTDDDPFGASEFVLQRMVSYSRLALSSEVLGPIASRMGTDTSALQSRVTAQAIPNSVLIHVTASARTPEQAADLSGAVISQLGRSIDTIESVGGPAGQAPVHLIATDAPTVPTSPSSPHMTTDVLAGAGAGALIGLVLLTAPRPCLRRPGELRRRASESLSGTGEAPPRLAIGRLLPNRAHRGTECGVEGSSADAGLVDGSAGRGGSAHPSTPPVGHGDETTPDRETAADESVTGTTGGPAGGARSR